MIWLIPIAFALLAGCFVLGWNAGCRYTNQRIQEVLHGPD